MRFTLILALLLLSPISAHAADAPLVYKGAANDPRERAALDMLIETNRFMKELPYVVAAKDLNGDGVEEWIFRQDRESACEVNAACTYIIVGLSQRKPIVLGEITAGKIVVAEEKSYGVRRLYVYNHKNDDFAYSYYAWTPEKGAFLPL